MHEQRQQPQLPFIPEVPPVVSLDGDPGIERSDHDPAVTPLFDLRAGADTDRGVQRLRGGMKEIKRPDVDGAPGKIDSRRGRSLEAAHETDNTCVRASRFCFSVRVPGSVPGSAFNVRASGFRVRADRRTCDAQTPNPRTPNLEHPTPNPERRTPNAERRTPN